MSFTPCEVTLYTCTDVHSANQESYGGGGGAVTPYNGLYGEAPPERPQVYERVGIFTLWSIRKGREIYHLCL